MVFTDYGLLQLGSFTRGDSPSSPTYCVFGAGSTSFDATINYLDDEVLRKGVTWSWSGITPQGNAILLTTDAVGSTLNELGLGVGATVGSNMWTRDLSAIGDKTHAFNVTLTFDVRYSRP